MGLFYAQFDDITGEPLQTPEFRIAPADDIRRAEATHEHIARTAFRLGKPVSELTRAELQPYDVTNRHADRGSYADPVPSEVIARWNNWHRPGPAKGRLRFSDGKIGLTPDEIRRLGERGYAREQDRMKITRAQARAIIGGDVR